jgi:phosphoribosylaminoimidazole-succinocarboxamide synthase
MTTKFFKQEDLLNEERAREMVSMINRSRMDPARVLDSVLHELGLGGYTTFPGKVTTCLIVPEGNLRIHIRRPTISTHDIVRGNVPGKDQTVNLINNTILGVIGSSFVAQIPSIEFGLSDQSPITVQHDCVAFKYEHVLREYMAETDTATSLWYNYKNGVRKFCGHVFPDGLVVNQKLDKIYDTPSTKEGHDVSVAPSYLYEKKIISQKEYEMIILPRSIQAFSDVSKFLQKKNIVLVDTKLEFGKTKESDPRYVFMDEAFTLDSSRFWRTNPDGTICENDGKPISFSKQFAREIVSGVNSLTEKQEMDVAVRYVISCQLITGQLFEPDTRDYEEILCDDLQKVFKKIS